MPRRVLLAASPLVFVAAVAVAAGCDRSPELAPVDASPVSSVATTAAPGLVADAAILDAAAALHRVSVSVASFDKGDVLDQCVDYQVSSALTPDAGADPEGKLAASLEAMMKTKTNTLTRVYKPCDQQFQTRGVLAHCTLHSTAPVPADAGNAGVDGGTFDIDVTLHFYELKTLERDDAYMKECLGLKGDWQGLDKSSDAYQEAVRARARR